MSRDADLRKLGSRGALIEQVLDAAAPGTPVLLSGVHGIGKTWLLTQIFERFTSRGRHSVFISAESNWQGQMSQLTPDTVVLFDDVDQIESEVFSNTILPLLSTHAWVSTATEQQAAPSSHQHAQISLGYSDIHQFLVQAHHLQVPPLQGDELERACHELAMGVLDATTVCSIAQLSWGRPGWIVYLWKLHELGALESYPIPRLLSVPLPYLYIPVAEWAHQAAVTQLSPKAVATALVLSELSPRTVEEAANLFGTDTIRSLTEAGYVTAVPERPEVSGVPELYAWGLRGDADPDVLSHTRRETAITLLEQERLGIMLPLCSAEFCAYTLQGEEVPAHLEEPRARLQQRVAEDRTNFGFRVGGLDLLGADPEVQANLSSLVRATTVARGPIPALRLLEQHSQQNPELPEPDSPDFEQFMMLALLRSVLESELNTERVSGRRPDPDDLPTELSLGCERYRHHELFALTRWNDTGVIDDDVDHLITLATEYPHQTIRLSAQYLLDIELARRGRTSQRQSHESSRALLSEFSLYQYADHQQLLSSLLVSEALVTTLRGEIARDADELLKIADRLQAAEFHKAWLRHLIAAFSALTVGHLHRAALEWDLFAQRVPRFTPLRSRELISSASRRLSANNSEPPSSRPSFHMLRYILGDARNISLDEARPSPLTAKTHSEILPVLGIMQAHQAASAEQNPAALMNVADHLRSLGLWAAATTALQEARAIFVSRRATRKAQACESELHFNAESVWHQLPWFDPTLLTSAFSPRLTTRERAAAELAADGFTDREIAAELGCSLRTVESHLAKARAKLGVSNRKDLAKKLPASRLNSPTSQESPKQHISE